MSKLPPRWINLRLFHHASRSLDKSMSVFCVMQWFTTMKYLGPLGRKYRNTAKSTPTISRSGKKAIGNNFGLSGDVSCLLECNFDLPQARDVALIHCTRCRNAYDTANDQQSKSHTSFTMPHVVSSFSSQDQPSFRT